TVSSAPSSRWPMPAAVNASVSSRSSWGCQRTSSKLISAIRAERLSDNGVFGPTAEDRCQGPDHLADGRVGMGRFDESGHEVGFGGGGVAFDAPEGGLDGVEVAGPLGLGQPLELVLLDLGSDGQDRRPALVAFGEGVGADQDAAAGVELALELVGRLRDLALEPALLDAGVDTFEDRAAADVVEVGEDRLGLAF